MHHKDIQRKVDCKMDNSYQEGIKSPEEFSRDLIDACKYGDPKLFADNNFNSLKDDEKKWIIGLGEFMIKKGWKKG